MKTESNEILSNVIIYDKYARHLSELDRRESWEEICLRNAEMHIKKYPQLKDKIYETYATQVIPKKVLPSMRSLQFGGTPIERNPSRIYNCAYAPVDDTDSFSELMFLLLGGTGVGYSVQYRHVNKLPTVRQRLRDERRYVVGDSIEGWSDAVKVLVESYFYGKERVRFDFDDIREKGSRLVVSGGKAPGPDPLRICLDKINAILRACVGRKIKPIECHDIMCHIADAVLSGGIRRAAMISLFSPEDMDMMTCKSGSWWELNPQRGRANNSVILLRGVTRKKDFNVIWQRVVDSGSGEPGIYWTNDLDWGTNPCCEIALRPYQFCNLTEINASDVGSQEELNVRARAASFIGTLQAGYTDFHYLRPVWRRTTVEDALIGVGMTGIASGRVLVLNLEEAAQEVLKENEQTANEIGIEKASRATTVKPSGTSSIVLGCSSGIHAWHSDYYIRRIRLTKDQPLCKYLTQHLPELVEDDFEKPHLGSVISFPQKSPDGSIVRGNDDSISLFNRAVRFNVDWVNNGYRSGHNHNNVSCTLSVKEDEWNGIGKALWANRNDYNGMAVLPHFGGTYKQAPFEDCDEKTYNYLMQFMRKVNLTDIKEEVDGTEHTQEAACAGGACEV